LGLNRSSRGCDTQGRQKKRFPAMALSKNGPEKGIHRILQVVTVLTTFKGADESLGRD